MSLAPATAGGHLAIPINRILAVFLGLHGFAHFVGTQGNLQLIRDGGSASLFDGAWNVGDPATLRVLAAAWAVVGVAFIVVGVMVWRPMPQARGALVVVTAVSLAFCIVSVWVAIIGVVINALVLLGAWLIPDRLGLRPARS